MSIDWLGVAVWGFWATAAMTFLESAGRWLNVTTMSTPVILGTFVTPERDRATLLGTAFHFVLGWIFASLYALEFAAIGRATWWIGALTGAAHALVMFGIVFPALPAVHRHMAGPHAPPSPRRALQAPGFLALNYGRHTIFLSMFSHACFGAILGALYDTPS